MPTLTLTITLDTDNELDDSLSVLEYQVAGALGFLGDVQTVDIVLDDETPDSSDEPEYPKDDAWDEEA